MEVTGRVKNGVVVLDESEAIPEGALVRVEPLEAKRPRRLSEIFSDVIGTAPELPDDMAAQHDHYLHGAPKR